MANFNDSDAGIDRYIGKSGNYIISQSLTGDNVPQPEVLVYSSIKQLFYSNYISGSLGEISEMATASFNNDGTINGKNDQNSFYNYDQTTLNPQKYFPTASQESGSVEIGVISIPSKLYGDHIKPGSIVIQSEQSGSLYDDGEGRIYAPNGNLERRYVGNVSYSHGLITITKQTYDDDPFFEGYRFIDAFITGSTNIGVNFSSSYTMFETQYKITISPDEYNYSLNPTLMSGSEGQVYDFVTGSYFQPYITTLGLYNEKHELMAVAKLAKPTPCSRVTDTTILVNLDRH